MVNTYICQICKKKLTGRNKLETGNIMYKCNCKPRFGYHWLLKKGKWWYWSERHASWVKYGNKPKPILISETFKFR